MIETPREESDQLPEEAPSEAVPDDDGEGAARDQAESSPGTPGDDDTATGNLKTVAAPGGIDLAYTYDGNLLTSAAWTGPFTGTVTLENNLGLPAGRAGGAQAIA